MRIFTQPQPGLMPGAALATLLLLFSSFAAGAAPKPKVIREVKHGVSQPLRDMAFASRPLVASQIEEDEVPYRRPPLSAAVDPVVQGRATRRLKTIPGMNLLGMGNGFTGPQGTFPLAIPPPDTNAAVGATQIVQTVNSAFAVFDKSTGLPTLGPVVITSFWTGFSSECSDLLHTHDPVVLYDKQAGRWVVELLTMGSPYFTCFAVSTSNDATGAYNLYAFQSQGVGQFAGQLVGTWPDAYYLASFTWTDSVTYLGPAACAVDRNQMLAGQPATMQCFQVQDSTISGMLPSDLDGSNAPPAGSPNYFLVQGPEGSSSLYLYKFHIDFSNPANSSFSGPVTINVASYIPGPINGVPAIPQLGTTEMLDVNGNLLMPRLAYRNFSKGRSPHESLLVTHSVALGNGSATWLGLRWYELRQPATTPIVYQQATYSPDTTSRWMGSIAMDKLGNIALGYSASSAAINPSIRYTGRSVTDPLGTMASEVTILTGTGSQVGSSRWGDYTSMSVDPADDCTMWYSNQYLPSNGALNWATRLYSFKFSSCR